MIAPMRSHYVIQQQLLFVQCPVREPSILKSISECSPRIERVRVCRPEGGRLLLDSRTKHPERRSGYFSSSIPIWLVVNRRFNVLIRRFGRRGQRIDIGAVDASDVRVLTDMALKWSRCR